MRKIERGKYEKNFFKWLEVMIKEKFKAYQKKNSHISIKM